VLEAVRIREQVAPKVVEAAEAPVPGAPTKKSSPPKAAEADASARGLRALIRLPLKPR